MTPSAPIVIARGARQAEAFLLAELARLHGEARADLALLAKPVRVVVPSRSLRDHLAARLVEEHGGTAGIQIQTLRMLAFELLERAGEGARGGQTLLPVLVRRFAAAEPALAQALGDFDDGFAVALASVNDLLDAGLDATNAASALECLAAAAGRAGEAVLGRAGALVRVAERVALELEKRGLEPRAGFFRRAAEHVARDPTRLASRALYFHGWADLTGVQLDLVEALVRGLGGCVVLDHPPEPSAAMAEGPGPLEDASPGPLEDASPGPLEDASPGPLEDVSPGPVWTERLRLRLGAERQLERASPAASLDALEAPGTHAEARAVAERVHGLLAVDPGLRPESIGIVLRDPAPYRHALHAQLGRLGIPFSGTAGWLGPGGRRVAALLELLERADACPADRWLDAQAGLGRDRLLDLRLAFHGIGVGRLRDVAKLDLEALLDGADRYPLRVRRGIFTVASDAEEGSGSAEAGEPAEPEHDAAPAPRARRRSVSREALATALSDAERVLSRLAALRTAAPLGAKLAALRALLARELGWCSAETPAAGEVDLALAKLERELGPGAELSTDELLVVLRRALAEIGREPLGGRGGGVGVLSALESRGRCFRHLFVMGMNRDVFPRLVREDPLLPDALRRALETVLPDVPVKQRGEDEERYLFAALCAAAPAVTLSWCATSDDGKERPPSPLVEPLRAAGLRARPAPPLLGERAGPRPAFEHAIRAGFAREREVAECALALSLGSEPVAHARASASRLLDVGAWPERLGPFFGFVGAAAGDDPRSGELAITRLEGLARCAWQSFLERVLGLEPPPDALAELPDATPLLVGNVVHAVMEELVAAAGGAGGAGLAALRERAPVTVAWPPSDALEQLALAAAKRAAREEGIVLDGFATLLARRALPLLARIRALDWADGRGPAVLGAEVKGEVEIPRADGTKRRVGFRADRADAVAGGVALVDYKTGAPIRKDARREETRIAHLLAQIGAGRRLQGPAYARAGEGVVEGRYLFAKEGVDDANAKVAIASDDPAVRERFEAAAREILAAFEAGAFPPRLLGEKRTGRGPACSSCDVAEACLQGETGSRRHLAAWLERHELAPERLPPAARAALALLTRVETR